MLNPLNGWRLTLQTTKDLSKWETVKLEAKRWASMLFIFMVITYMFYVAVCIPPNIFPDLIKIMIVPRIEDHILLKWLLAAYLALVVCVEWFLFGVLQRARARLKRYSELLNK